MKGWTTSAMQAKQNGVKPPKSKAQPEYKIQAAFVREITFTIPYLTDGLNGKTGLIRGHFMAAKKEKEYIAAILREQKPQGFYPITRRIKVTYTRYTSHLMDWDNACASFKHIGDALQMAGILSDDSPAVIAVFVPIQVKCKMAERRTEILIELI